ncbi:MAG TPA: radical SAM family heme chaperone HemW [Terracidiphilus sp.]|nr:radical SAM family heme chaperone HemW [Terracidiphilus sp.]
MDAHDVGQLGIYVSIPFCRSKCTYCNFASGVYPASEHQRYVERLIQDLRGAASWTRENRVELPRIVDSVYLGGGTPSLLAPDLIAKLFAAMRNAFALDPDCEITMECAPGQLPQATIEAMVAAGVNRVSLGVQSFIDREAQVSGRLHNRAIVEDDIARLRDAGIANVNVDLIAGLAGQTSASWEESLDALFAAGTPHASVYMLEVDEDSRLGREMLAGGARYYAELVPSDEAIATMYERAIERLSGAGLVQYEISNFAHPGFESRHNLRYWHRRPYLGVGLDASSALYATDADEEMRPLFRAKTTDDLKEYLAGPCIVETAWLNRVRQHEEAWFLGLRLNVGVEIAALEHKFGAELAGPACNVARGLALDGLLEFDGRFARLTERGRLLSNEVFQEFISGPASQRISGARSVKA